MKKFFTLVSLLSILFAQPTKEMVKAQALLFPKILFLDYEIDKKLLNDQVILFILYDTPKDKKIATYFQHYLQDKELFGKKIQTKIYPIKKIPKKLPTAYILISQNKKLPIKTNRLIFSYYPSNIKNSSISLLITNKPIPILNPKDLKAKGIELKPIIFKVAKLYEK